jgi:hypothetical protein
MAQGHLLTKLAVHHPQPFDDLYAVKYTENGKNRTDYWFFGISGEVHGVNKTPVAYVIDQTTGVAHAGTVELTNLSVPKSTRRRLAIGFSIPVTDSLDGTSFHLFVGQTDAPKDASTKNKYGNLAVSLEFTLHAPREYSRRSTKQGGGRRGNTQIQSPATGDTVGSSFSAWGQGGQPTAATLTGNGGTTYQGTLQQSPSNSVWMFLFAGIPDYDDYSLSVGDDAVDGIIVDSTCCPPVPAPPPPAPQQTTPPPANPGS